MKIISRTLPFLLVIGLGASPIVQADSDTKKLITSCEGCHGSNGNSENPDVPVIAGYSEDGFLDTLAAFRDDERIGVKFRIQGGPEMMMNDIAKGLSEEQVKALSKYFSSKAFTPRVQKVDMGLAKEGAVLHKKNCEKCHSEGGGSPQDDAAILAGQWMPYLTRQFENMKTGKRIVPSRMQKKINKLSEDDKKALVQFYGSNNLLLNEKK
jgi:sulfide dehydrogenase cytochrome subunit